MRGEHTDHEEFLYRLPSGKEVVLLSSARPIRDTGGKVIGSVQVSLDITERKRDEEQRRLLAKELNHRVKNNLAVVQALVQQTIRNSTDLTEAGTTIGARLSALARGHDVLTKHSWEEGDLREVVEAGLAGHMVENRVSTSGPDIKLVPSLVMTITLAIHELATNAMKYGALSNATGSVSISWEAGDRDEGRAIAIEWAEAGGPPVKEPAARGFGSRLLKRMAEGAGGSATLSYPTEGLRCFLVLPLQTAD
jgi:two-component sensor histidine kinase